MNIDVEATAKEKALAMIAVRQKNDAEIMKAGANANIAIYQEPAQRSALAADSDEPDLEGEMAAASAEAKQILAEAAADLQHAKEAETNAAKVAEDAKPVAGTDFTYGDTPATKITAD